ncbi:hypothetical protein H5410_011561 [Solanum commersonii]|uniref:Uncharacterized protein n=1 Tax=Solanum commersonii TaxID=4109 RepID=A0A9J6AQG3_SOLCO|nr:hypothetical protein H5410_011561 [Solanum commersonii]
MLEKSQQQLLRVAMLKQRYAHIIVKSQQQVLGDAYDEEEMKKKAALWDKQLQEQKDNSKRKRDEDRKAARIAIESIKRTVSFGDDLQAERDFLTIIGCRSRCAALVRIAIMGEVEAYPALLPPLQSEEGFSFRFEVSAL